MLSTKILQFFLSCISRACKQGWRCESAPSILSELHHHLGKPGAGETAPFNSFWVASKRCLSNEGEFSLMSLQFFLSCIIMALSPLLMGRGLVLQFFLSCIQIRKRSPDDVWKKIPFNSFWVASEKWGLNAYFSYEKSFNSFWVASVRQSPPHAESAIAFNSFWVASSPGPACLCLRSTCSFNSFWVASATLSQ